MAWGLEARVPFLDKAFLDVALNTDAKEKMFSKGASQQVDEDGRPKMEKVGLALPSAPRARARGSDTAAPFSTSSAKPSISPPTARFAAGSSRSECMMMADPPLALIRRSHTCPGPSCGDRRSSSRTASATPG